MKRSQRRKNDQTGDLTAFDRFIMSTKAFILFLLTAGAAAAQDGLRQLRAGIVGLDTSHVPAFTKLFNKGETEGDLAGIRVTTGYTGGTDMPASRDRKEKFTQQLREMGVEIVPTIPELLAKVDVVLLESVDGRIHLQEAREIFKAGKPVFIDKPLAGTLAEAIAIVELAKKHGVPFFSSSSSRFGAEMVALRNNKDLGELLGAQTWGPCSYQEGTPDFFFYGIHGIEALYTLMGPGCESVSRVKAGNHDMATGVWKGGRVGAYRGIVKGKADFGAVAYGSKAVGQAAKAVSYEGLCRQIGRFFRTGQAPVSAEETIEIFTFMEAADESLRQGGRPVELAGVLDKARAEAAKLLK
jgi:hypothetical protein